MRFRLRTLLIVLAIGPIALTGMALDGNPGPGIAIGLIFYWSLEVAIAIKANLMRPR
jgi:hypothetical protein